MGRAVVEGTFDPVPFLACLNGAEEEGFGRILLSGNSARKAVEVDVASVSFGE